jgi:agarase
MYQDYLRTVLDHPAFVGCHWFQYIDEPLTGRTYDGENYNIGFLTVTDAPYPEMVAAAKAAHGEAYARRFGASHAGATGQP